jgi:ankyrin repeat protein
VLHGDDSVCSLQAVQMFFWTIRCAISKSSDPNNRLLDSASSCDVVGVTEALKAGADTNSRESAEGQTPLLLCLRGRKGPQQQLAPGITFRQVRSADNIRRIFDLLLEAGAEVNVVDYDGTSPLHWAVGHCFTDIVRALLQAGAKVNEADNQGYTPLIQVSPNGHTKIAQMLLGSGAYVNARTHKGETAIYFAKANGHSELAQLLVENVAND